MEKITKHQKDIMEHAISGPNRNWFGTDLKCRDSIEFQKMVEAGYATKETPPKWMGDELIYRVTKEGRKAISEYYKD